MWELWETFTVHKEEGSYAENVKIDADARGPLSSHRAIEEDNEPL